MGARWFVACGLGSILLLSMLARAVEPPSTPRTEATAPNGPNTPQDAEDEPRPLEVVVRGTRPGARGSTVEKLDRTMLDRFGATSVAEALDRSPAAMSAFGSRGERIVSLRGFDQRQILVTVDGVPVQVPYDGQLDLGKVPLGLVDHITVVKGAGSLLYGPNGLGGAIDIATRRPGEGPSLVLSTESAPFTAQRYSGLGTVRRGPVAVLAGISFENVLSFALSDSYVATYNEDGGERENSDRRSLTAVGKGQWALDDHNDIVATAWHLDGQFGVPPGVYDLTRRFWRWSDWHVHTYALAHGHRGATWTTDETLYYSIVGNTLDVYDSDSYASQVLPASGTTMYDDRTLGGNARVSARLRCSETGCVTVRGWLGAKADWHRSQSARETAWTTVDTTTLTGAGQVDGPLGRTLLWLVGTQLDTEQPGRGAGGDKPDATAGLGPMGALTWRPADVFDVTASAAQRTRFPTLKERFSSAFGDLEPNPSLAPERATNVSLDVSYRPVRTLRLDAGVFDSEVQDLIIRVPLRAQTQQWQNAGRARFYGVEAALRARPAPWAELWAGWAAIQARRLDQAPPADSVAYVPNQKATVSITVAPIRPLAATLVGRAVGSQRFQNPDTSQWGRLGGFQMIDARVDVRAVRGLRLWVRGTNLTDVNAMGHYSFPEPGRQVFAGASLTWPEQADDPLAQGVL